MMLPSGIETEVALKVLRVDIDPASQAARRLQDEGMLLGRLNHPHIVRVFDLAELEGRLTLITEYVPGMDLAEALDLGPLPLRPALDITSAIASALHAAWSTVRRDTREPLHLVHRDLKPANIRLSIHGDVKLLDFGIAWTDAMQRAAKTQTSALVGSPVYMAPERFTRDASAPAADVFSLGCCLFEAVTRQRLFDGFTLMRLGGLAQDEQRFQETVDQRLEMLPEDCPPAVRQLLADMLAWQPERRPSADIVEAILRDISQQLPQPGLITWIRQQHWHTTPERTGPWEGRTLVESLDSEEAATWDEPPPEAPNAPPVNPMRPLSWMGLALLGAVLFLTVLVGSQRSTPTASMPRPAAPPANPSVDVSPRTNDPGASAADTTAAPTPTVEHSRATPRPPASTPPLTADTTRRGQVFLDADQQEAHVWVVSATGEAYRLPSSSIPVGAYRIEASFEGAARTDAGALLVETDTPKRVRCSARMHRCSVSP